MTTEPQFVELALLLAHLDGDQEKFHRLCDSMSKAELWAFWDDIVSLEVKVKWVARRKDNPSL